MNDTKSDVASLPAKCGTSGCDPAVCQCAACDPDFSRKLLDDSLAKPASGDGLLLREINRVLNGDILQTLLNVSNGIDSPASASIAASAVVRLNYAKDLIRRLATPEQPGSSVQVEEYPEAVEVCAEAAQFLGSLLDELGLFGTEKGDKILDNLAACKLVHKDILPWRTFDAATTPPAPAAEQAEDHEQPTIALALWIVSNLLNESQLSVIPPGYNKSLRYLLLEEPEDRAIQPEPVRVDDAMVTTILDAGESGTWNGEFIGSLPAATAALTAALAGKVGA